MSRVNFADFMIFDYTLLNQYLENSSLYLIIVFSKNVPGIITNNFCEETMDDKRHLLGQIGQNAQKISKKWLFFALLAQNLRNYQYFD